MKFTDHKSPEKAIINTAFKSIPYMDMWVSSIVEGYIYEKVEDPHIFGHRQEYTERYGKGEGEYKAWWKNGKLWRQENYKRGKLDGESKIWFYDGELVIQRYYKEGKLEGEYKEWHHDGQLAIQENYKEGKKEGEAKWFNEKGILILHRIYKDGEDIKELLYCGTNSCILN